jgi:hypothetical protein
MDPVVTPSIMPVTGNAQIDHWLAILGIAVTAASTAATFLNAKIREAIDAEGSAPKLFLWLGVIVNTLAFNADKVSQMQKLLNGHEVTVIMVHSELPAAAGESTQPAVQPEPPKDA